MAAQRMLEVRVSRMNEAELHARGGIEHAAEQMPIMVAVHSGWLIACLAEVWLFDRPFHRALALPMLLVFCAGQALRIAAIRALGVRWTVKVLVVPGETPVSGGIFRYLRHPNYLGVILEIVALPLVHTAWLTAVVFSAANGALLYRRILAEEQALAASSDYDARFADRARLVPRGSRR
ncbi:MAG: isoprenylcysteine carboxylmethyltransferase family protein [Polyangiales bacterium]